MNNTSTHSDTRHGVVYQTLVRDESVVTTPPVETPPAIEFNGEMLFYSVAIALMLIGLGFLLIYFWGVLTA